MHFRQMKKSSKKKTAPAMINPPAIIGSDGFIRTHAAELTIVNTIHTAKKNKVENKRKLQSKALKGFVAQGERISHPPSAVSITAY